MKKQNLIVLAVFILCLSFPAGAKSHLIESTQSMSNEEVWQELNGGTKFGNCKIQDATTCEKCFCPYYFISAVKGSGGHLGWPKNPQSGDSTGCLGKGCWGGYTSGMCTTDVKANAKAILLDALTNGACGN